MMGKMMGPSMVMEQFGTGRRYYDDDLQPAAVVDLRRIDIIMMK